MFINVRHFLHFFNVLFFIQLRPKQPITPTLQKNRAPLCRFGIYYFIQKCVHLR